MANLADVHGDEPCDKAPEFSADSYLSNAAEFAVYPTGRTTVVAAFSPSSGVQLETTITTT